MGTPIELIRVVQKLTGGKEQDALKIEPEERPGFYTDNFLQRALARLWGFSGSRWEPSVGDINEVPFVFSGVGGAIVGVGTEPGIINLKYKGIIRDIQVIVDGPDAEVYFTKDNVHMDFQHNDGSDYNYVKPSWLREVGWETELYRLMKYDDINNFYIIHVKGIIPFDHWFTMYIRNPLPTTLNWSVRYNVLRVRDRLEDLVGWE